MKFCNSKLVRTGVLALNSNSYFLEAIYSLLALGGGNNFVTSFGKGGQAVTKCVKRGCGSILSQKSFGVICG